MIRNVCYLEEIGACTNDTAGKKDHPANLRGMSPFARRPGTNCAILRGISQNTKKSTHQREKHQLTVHGSGHNQSVCWIQIHRVHLENRNLFTAVFPRKTSTTLTIASKTYQADFRRRDFLICVGPKNFGFPVYDSVFCHSTTNINITNLFDLTILFPQFRPHKQSEISSHTSACAHYEKEKRNIPL